MTELLIMPYFYHYLYHYHYHDIHGVLGNWRRARHAMHCSVLYCMEDEDDDDEDDDDEDDQDDDDDVRGPNSKC